MRISDWSSDVCSSDLAHLVVMGLPGRHIMPFQPCSCRQLLGKGGLARTGAAQHECHMPGAAHRFAGKMVGTAIDARRAATAAAISVKARTIRSVMRRPPWFIMDRADRKSVVEGKSGSVRVDLGGRRIIKQQKKKK